MKNNKISECLTFLYKHYIALIFSILVGIFIFTSCFTDQAYLGLSIESKSPVNFSLYDQHGDLKSLDDFSGKIILMTFLYSTCSDICPDMTNLLLQIDAKNTLGNDVVFLIISVDSEVDNNVTVNRYLDSISKADSWVYLMGNQEELVEILDYYYVSNFKRSGSEVSKNKETVHSSPLYLLDREGNTQILYTMPFDAMHVLHDVELMAKR